MNIIVGLMHRIEDLISSVKFIALMMIFTLTVLCTGCIGSALMHDENDQPLGEFGDLHSVPDRPLPPNMQELLKTRHALESAHKTDI